MKTLTLLGLPFQDEELRQTEEQWNERDMATKQMLHGINQHRMDKLGRASMTGIALHQKTGEEWEIIVQNKIREYKEEEDEMTDEEKLQRQEDIQQAQATTDETQKEERMYQERQHDIYQDHIREQEKYKKQSNPFNEQGDHTEDRRPDTGEQ